jgi:LDH2 family malate/lactate/ureidoglycolate dehydrogenase
MGISYIRESVAEVPHTLGPIASITKAVQEKIMATNRPTRIVKSEALYRLMKDLLLACGCSENIAAVQANMHMEADLRGVGIQGLDHMFNLIQDIRNGHIKPTTSPDISKDLGSTVLIDGNAGLGVPAALLAVDVAASRATKYGSCIVGVTNSSDIFMLGFYGELLARKECVAVLATHTQSLVHAPGGTDAVIGTNPLVIAIPTPGPHPILLDMATSHWAASYFRQAAYHGESVPEGLAFGPDGHPTVDPSAALRGAIAPLGGHKGFGLGFCIGILTGPLVGTPVGKLLSGQWNLGHLFIAIDPGAFGNRDEFLLATQRHIDEVKQSRRTSDVQNIRVPGERLFATRERQLREGIVIYEEVWKRAEHLARELSVSIPT